MAAGLSQGPGSGVSEPGMQGRTGWTPGRIAALVAGCALLVVTLGLIGGGGVLAWADQQQQGGYLITGTATYSTGGYALVSDPVSLHDGWGWAERFLGEVRIRVTSARPVFAGIGRADDVWRYLAGVSYTHVTAIGDRDVAQHLGTAVPAPPAAVDWVARAQGTGTQTLRWQVQGGDWMVVVLNSGGSAGVTVRADAGLSSPALPWLAGELLAAGVMTGVLAAALIVIPARMAAART